MTRVMQELLLLGGIFFTANVFVNEIANRTVKKLRGRPIVIRPPKTAPPPPSRLETVVGVCAVVVLVSFCSWVWIAGLSYR